MIPKEKAKELVRKYWDLGMIDIPKAQKCALIAVEEILNSIVIIDLTTAENQFIYWQQVKSEIEKL